jgi:hypothetical protein
MNFWNTKLWDNYRPDDGGRKHLWNVGKLLPDCTALQPRRQPSSYSPPWEPQIQLRWMFLQRIQSGKQWFMKSSNLLVQWKTSLVADGNLVVHSEWKAASFTSRARDWASVKPPLWTSNSHTVGAWDSQAEPVSNTTGNTQYKPCWTSQCRSVDTKLFLKHRKLVI